MGILAWTYFERAHHFKECIFTNYFWVKKNHLDHKNQNKLKLSKAEPSLKDNCYSHFI